MSGEGWDWDGDTPEYMWAHILWQKRGLRIEEFAEMPRKLQLLYIASEQLASEKPINAADRIAKGLLRKK